MADAKLLFTLGFPCMGVERQGGPRADTAKLKKSGRKYSVSFG